MDFVESLFAGPYGPLVIFGLRIVDVSLSTVRILLAVRGHKLVVPFIGFFEVLLWVFAAGNAGGVTRDAPIARARDRREGGLHQEAIAALGPNLGIADAGVALADALRTAGFGVTEFAAQGRDGPVEVIYSVCMRRDIPRFIAAVS